MAREAGEITLRHFKKVKTPELKSDGSFVTAADRETETFLREAIARKFPDDAILGEEEAERSGTSVRRWIVDPIDGTYSFVHGVPFYGVMIALLVDDEPTVGVVNIPVLGEIVYAAKNLGCFWNGESVRVSQTSTLGESLLLCTDFGTCADYGFGEAANRLQSKVKARRTWGDCYGHVLVATGRAEIMLDPIMNVWDCAALLPILEEAGGTFTDWQGEKTIHGGNALSTNGILFSETIELIKK
ncbi:MAG: inositol monophosphatase family protein [Pyrinomonadaceae bacterium]